MARRTRLTPFARFIIVMIIVAPLAYLGASYYNGEDGIQNLKELIGIAEPEAPAEPAATEIEATPTTSADSETAPSEAAAAEMGYEELQDRFNELKQENLDLKQKLQEKELEIQELKRQLRLQEGATE
jgi:ribosomal protein L29